MNSLIYYLLEASICLALFYGAYHWLLRKEGCFQYNRAYLVGSSMLALLIPTLQFSLPLAGSSAVGFDQLLQDISIGVNKETRATINYTVLTMSIIYMVGIGIVGWRLLANLRRLHHLIRQGSHHKPAGKRFTLVHAHRPQPAFSFLNYLVVGPKQGQESEAILAHEEVHIKQLHSIDVLWFELLTVVFWFNPVLWLYRRAIALTHEYIADKATMQQTGARKYASLLAKSTLQHMQLPVAHHFGQAPVMKRIQMIIHKQKPTPMLKFIAPIVLMFAALFAFGCETVAPATDAVIEDQAAGNGGALSDNEGPDKDGVYTVVDQTPMPEGGLQVLFDHIIKNLEYPEQARKNGVEGKVYVQFVINQQGELTDVEAVKGIGAGCDAAAIDVVQSANLAWKPGVHEGKKVAVRLTLPINFELDDDDDEDTEKH